MGVVTGLLLLPITGPVQGFRLLVERLRDEAESVLDSARSREAKENQFRSAIEKGASTAELLGLLPALERMGLV